MVREPNIPLFLWIATAILVHLTWGGGAEKVSEAVQEQMDVRRFALSVSTQVRRGHGPLEISIEPSEPFEPDQPEEQEPPPAPETLAPNTPPDKTTEPEKKPEEQAAAKPEAKPETKVVEALPQPLNPESIVKVPNRIAVQQLVEDKNQKSNPNAALIGEHDNHVKEETQSRITSTEQNDANPTPGGAHTGPTPEPGDSHVTEIAQLDDRSGAPDRAPGNPSDGEHETSQAPEAALAGSKVAQASPSQGDPQITPNKPASAQPEPDHAPDPGRQGQAARTASNDNPGVHHAHDGHFHIAENSPAQTDQQGRVSQKRKLPPPRGQKSPSLLLGLGANGTTQGGLNLNLTHSDALATVGKDKLAQQIAADGERRRSKHRGSWRTTGLERWRSAIENYVPHVKPGNQTALNTARVPFALYLNKIHLRLHPIFADQFLAHLDSMPSSNPLNRIGMKTNIEIVLNRADGSIVDLGVTKASGVTAFDIGALDSVSRAAPFGTPPSAIVSPDGNVYLHWEFHRDPNYACSTYFAFPKMLQVAPKSAPVESPLPAPLRPEEDTPPGQGRQGFLLPRTPVPTGRLATAPWFGSQH